MPSRLLTVTLLVLLGLSPVQAEGPNLLTEGSDLRGAAAQLALAQGLYRQAEVTGDPVLLLAAIRLARGVATRQAPGWQHLGESSSPPIPGPERAGPSNPASEAAIEVLQGLAADDPDLLDLAYDLTARVPPARRLPVATVAPGGLSGGGRTSWRLPLAGSVAAEIALIGDGSGPLGLTITDDSGAVICARPPSLDPALCRFTPARNGFFTTEVWNAGAEWNSYQLVGN